MTREKQENTVEPVDTGLNGSSLILFNDEHNTFEFVIETLMSVCGHTAEQAEQCAIIAHMKGRCGIRSGDRSELLPLHRQMLDLGLTTSIE
jgi:ATP-dependent Clp protease adaptor protein ClpS